MELSTVITRTPGLQLIRGTVLRITGDTFTMEYLGVEVPQVAPLDQYTPTVGDIAIVLVWPKGGMLALGSNNGTGAPGPGVPYPSTTLVVNADGSATYGGGTIWDSGVLVQSPVQAGCWFYDIGLFAPMSGSLLASFEVEVVRTEGGPVELLMHGNSGPSGVLNVVSPTWFLPPQVPAVGVATWLPAPIGWGEMLVNGMARGVGIGLHQHTGTYSGTGRLRFTSV